MIATAYLCFIVRAMIGEVDWCDQLSVACVVDKRRPREALLI